MKYKFLEEHYGDLHPNEKLGKLMGRLGKRFQSFLEKNDVSPVEARLIEAHLNDTLGLATILYRAKKSMNARVKEAKGRK